MLSGSSDMASTGFKTVNTRGVPQNKLNNIHYKFLQVQVEVTNKKIIKMKLKMIGYKN